MRGVQNDYAAGAVLKHCYNEFGDPCPGVRRGAA
jgi:hypothetical protein